MKGYLYSLTLFLSIFLFVGCEKEINVDLPTTEPKLVVEGKIEMGANPIIVLTKTTNYFDPTDLASVAESFVGDATITISDGTTTNNMTKICSSSLTPPQQEALAEQLGIAVEILQNYNICGFTDVMIGEVGKSYTININWQGKNYASTTTIPDTVALDSTWFEVEGNLDSLGFLWAIISEPAQEGNAYRWYAKRINKYTFGDNVGEQKDGDFLAPSGSVFNDDFINGQTFEFGYNRSSLSNKEDDNNAEKWYYKVGDTVVVKFCTIDKSVYKFLNESDIQSQSTGSPFASPINVTSNISNGALGVWAGYGITYDTIICTQ